MTQEQELAIIRPWALKHELEAHPNGFDIVSLYATINGRNIYKLWNSQWNPHHKMGYPKLVVIDNNIPIRLAIEEVKYVIASLLSSHHNTAE